MDSDSTRATSGNVERVNANAKPARRAHWTVNQTCYGHHLKVWKRSEQKKAREREVGGRTATNFRQISCHLLQTNGMLNTSIRGATNVNMYARSSSGTAAFQADIAFCISVSSATLDAAPPLSPATTGPAPVLVTVAAGQHFAGHRGCCK